MFCMEPIIFITFIDYMFLANYSLWSRDAFFASRTATCFCLEMAFKLIFKFQSLEY